MSNELESAGPRSDGGKDVAESEDSGEADSVAEERAENEGMPSVRPEADDER